MANLVAPEETHLTDEALKEPVSIPSPMIPGIFFKPIHRSSLAITVLLFGLVLSVIFNYAGAFFSTIIFIITATWIDAHRKTLSGVRMLLFGCFTSIFLCVLFAPHRCVNSHKAKESSMVSNLSILRNALEQFQADTGVYPVRLDDLGEPPTKNGIVGATKIKPGTYKGPYLRAQGGLGKNLATPRNPFYAKSSPVETIAPASDPPKAHWSYNPKTGKVLPGCTGKTEDGKDYRDL